MRLLAACRKFAPKRVLHRARHALRCGNGGINVPARMEITGWFRFRQGFSVTRGRGKIVLGETGGGEGVISTGDAQELGVGGIALPLGVRRVGDGAGVSGVGGAGD